MSSAVDLNLLLAIAIVLLAIVVFAYTVYAKIAAVGFLRADFDRRAGWVALGVVIGGVLLYFTRG